jgi:ELWxxDGT repeat protein
MRALAVACLIPCLLAPVLAAERSPARGLTVTEDPVPPAGEWLADAAVPGFRFKVRIAGSTMGRREAACISETLCVSGALAGRSEVFLRVVGPKPNGRLWPTLVKFSTSLVEVWVEQTSSGEARYYQLGASGQGSSLPGVVDRSGFPPAGAAAEPVKAPVQAVSASLLADIWPGVGSGNPRDFHRIGNLIYFFADSSASSQYEVWRTDGTASGTFRVTPSGRLFRTVWATGSALAYFYGPSEDASADDKEEVWRSDGTEAGTFRVATTSLLRGTGLNSPWICYVPERDLLFFAAGEPGTKNVELWVSDGTVAGTHRVVDLNPDGGSYPSRMVALGGRLFFVRKGPASSSDREIWTSDGTAAGTYRVKDLYEGFDGVEGLSVAAGKLLIFAREPQGHLKLWRSDGTEAGTVPVIDTPAYQLVGTRVAGDRLFFSLAVSSVTADQLWVTTGNASGTVQLLSVPDPGGDPYWDSLTPAGDGVFFLLPEPGFGSEPAWSDGTPGGTRRIADLCPGECSSSPRALQTYRGRVLFTADDGASGSEPWITDGSTAGTSRLGDLCPGECGSFAGDFVEIDGQLVFSARVDGGLQIWMSGGTAAGTARITDFPAGFLQDTGGVLPGGLLLVGEDETHGRELWLLPLGDGIEDPPPPPGDWITSASLPGFRVKARLTSGSDVRGVRQEPCIGETVCLSGALPGRPELFVRVVGPKPNGNLWPTLVRFTTSTAEVWIEQIKTGTVRYYRLEAPPRDSERLDGFFDRTGFLP